MGRAVAAFQGQAYLGGMRRLILLLIGLLVLPMPAVAGELIKLRDMDARIAAISHRLATANLALCPFPSPLQGMLVQDIGQYAPEWRAEAQADLGLSDVPTVTVVVPGSSAARAGVRVGDHILAVDGTPTPRSTLKALASYQVVEATLAQLAAALQDGSVRLLIDRGGNALYLALPNP